MKSLGEYNLREIKNEFLSRVSVGDFSTHQLLEEVKRRDEGVSQVNESGLLPIHRSFLVFCAQHFDLTVSQLTGPRRHQGLSNARQVSMVVSSRLFRLGGHQASRLFQRKNHTSLVYAKKVLRDVPALADEAVVLETRWKNRHKIR